MERLNRHLLLGAIVISLMANACVAQLSFYDVTVGMKYGSEIGTALLQLTGVTTSVAGHTAPVDEYAGTISLTVTPKGSSTSTTFDSYCVGLFETVYVNQTYTGAYRFIPEPSTGIEPGSALLDATRRAAVLYTTFAADAAQDRTRAAALQAAMWKAMYADFNFTGLSSNYVAYSSDQVNAFRTQVDTYYGILATANLSDHQYDAYQWAFYNYNAGSPQDSTLRADQYLIGPITVPEPAEMGLAVVVVLSALGVFEIRKRRNPAKTTPV